MCFSSADFQLIKSSRGSRSRTSTGPFVLARHSETKNLSIKNHLGSNSNHRVRGRTTQNETQRNNLTTCNHHSALKTESNPIRGEHSTRLISRLQDSIPRLQAVNLQLTGALHDRLEELTVDPVGKSFKMRLFGTALAASHRQIRILQHSIGLPKHQFISF